MMLTEKLSKLDRILIGVAFGFAFLSLIDVIVMVFSSLSDCSEATMLRKFALLLFGVGFLYYSLARIRNPRKAIWFLVVSVPISVMVLIISAFV